MRAASHLRRHGNRTRPTQGPQAREEAAAHVGDTGAGVTLPGPPPAILLSGRSENRPVLDPGTVP